MQRTPGQAWIDRAWRDPELAAAVDALEDGEVRPSLTALAAVREDPHRRELRAVVLGQVGQGRLAELEKGAATDRRNPDRWLLAGHAALAAAWTERGAALAAGTSPEQFHELIRLTGRAQDALDRAAGLEPDDPVPYSALLSCLLGVGGTEAERDAVFAAVLQRCPTLVGAHFTRVQMLAGKWYGSDERMLAFGREVARRAAPGDPLAAVLAAAHVEGWVATSQTGARLTRMWRASRYVSADVVAELRDAGDRLLAGDGGHPQAEAAHQLFAFVFALRRQDDLTRPHLDRGGPQAAVWPWCYLGDPVAEYAKAHVEVGSVPP